jgi:hypothetical protein
VVRSGALTVPEALSWSRELGMVNVGWCGVFNVGVKERNYRQRSSRGGINRWQRMLGQIAFSMAPAAPLPRRPEKARHKWQRYP